MTGGQLDLLLPGRRLDHELAAVVAVGIGKEEREGDIRADAVHEWIVHMGAVMLPAPVAAEEQRRESLRAHRQAEHLVGEDRPGHPLAQHLEGRSLPGLLVVLHELGAPPRRGPAILEAHGPQGIAGLLQVGRGQHVGNRDQHGRDTFRDLSAPGIDCS
jgi:hypothetical protein